jgi:hypothetical protein
MEKDGIRYQDADFALINDQKIKNFLDIMNVPYNIVTGDMVSRVQMVKERLGFEDRRHQPILLAVQENEGQCKE